MGGAGKKKKRNKDKMSFKKWRRSQQKLKGVTKEFQTKKNPLHRTPNEQCYKKLLKSHQKLEGEYAVI